MLVLKIVITVLILMLLAYLAIDNRIEHGMFRDVLSLARKSIDKCEELTNDLKLVLERCKKVEQENDTLRSIIRLNDCDNYLRKQEEDGNI